MTRESEAVPVIPSSPVTASDPRRTIDAIWGIESAKIDVRQVAEFSDFE